MGVEYKHFLIPADPDFVPEKQSIIHVYRLLEKWQLLTGPPEIYDLTKGINTIVQESPDNLEIGHGLAIRYPGVQGEAVRKLMGESYYTDDVTDSDRYIQNFTYILGSDFRIHSSGEELSVTVIKNPEQDGIPLEPYGEYDELHYAHDQAYHSSLTTTPPEVDVVVADTERMIGDQEFSGYWRAAVVIDCGKDLPKLGDTLYKIENREFINDLEMALGTRLIEIGQIG